MGTQIAWIRSSRDESTTWSRSVRVPLVWAMISSNKRRNFYKQVLAGCVKLWEWNYESPAAYSEFGYSEQPIEVCLHVTSPCPSKSLSKFNIVFMVLDTLTGKMSLAPILFFKVKIEFYGNDLLVMGFTLKVFQASCAAFELTPEEYLSILYAHTGSVCRATEWIIHGDSGQYNSHSHST